MRFVMILIASLLTLCVCVQVGSLLCAGLQERLAAHRDHGGGLGLQGGGGEQCGGGVRAAQPTLPDTGYRWEQARVHTSGH